ncbi:hypothetical protein N0V93_007574 [Gnomoniopsis smithogilvyi]|uniref:DNA repair protein Rad26 n=1 Tax=Gnomoniopsis smithogilvyi TaxID=1191159 RepID=A0A9W8YSY3_9PEZI|nr:hypothetical protein N0V93_007574 [Gnomoniopsis smithogilvyi]
MDDFSDDGFDDLNDTTLQELENNAIQFTQAQKLYQTQTQSTQLLNDNDEYGLEDDDLDDTVVIDEAAQLPVRHPVERQVQGQAYPTTAQSSLIQEPRSLLPRGIPQPRWQQQSPSGPRAPTQLQPTRPAAPSSSVRNGPHGPSITQRMAPPPLPISNRAIPVNSQHLRPQPPPNSSFHSVQQQHQDSSHNNGRNASQNPTDLVEALQARVRALENDLNSARGEVSIVRSKHDKSVAAHDSEIARLKKQNTEALAKQERLVEAAIHAEKAASTELQFTRQDLREELQRSKKQRTESVQSGTSTPRKNKANGRKNVADGFDDVEILPSPSKGQGGAKGKNKVPSGAPGERTPSRGKRKRPTVDSPVTALEVEDDVVMLDATAGASSAQVGPPGTILRPNALPYDLLRLVLDHGAIHGQPLTFDLLARYSFPSDPDQSFAGVIFQRIPSLGDPHDPVRLLIDFCDMIIDLWDQCLREKYYEPIYDLVALITFILQLNTISVAPYIASTLIPVAHTTIYLLAVPRFESQNGDLSTSPDESIQHLTLNIDTEGVLQLMYLVALGCVDSYLLDPAQPLNLGPDRDSPQRLFWKLMQIDFVLVMLSHKQPRDEFLGMLSLLCTSCLPTSIGPITSDPERGPEFVAQALIERVSKIMHMPMLWAMTPPASVAPFGHRSCVIRLAALRTLMAFAQSSLGAKQLALSDMAIPRLVNVLCGAIDALYDMDVPVDLFESASHKPEDNTHDTTAKQINSLGDIEGMQLDTPADGTGTVMEELPSSSAIIDPNPTPLLYTLISSIILLLHTLVTDPATSEYTDMRAKLSTSHGASQKYLLTLSRLNFAEENLVLEAGIDPGTCDRANDLLDLAITPDEAEGVRAVFGGWS